MSGANGSSTHASPARRSHGRTKNGEISATAFRFPYFTGSVSHPPARSPSASEKSFVDEAPRRKRPKRPPIAHGSAENAEATSVQPATFRSVPRGIAIVTFAQTPRRFVRPNAGTE